MRKSPQAKVMSRCARGGCPRGACRGQGYWRDTSSTPLATIANPPSFSALEVNHVLRTPIAPIFLIALLSLLPVKDIDHSSSLNGVPTFNQLKIENHLLFSAIQPLPPHMKLFYNQMLLRVMSLWSILQQGLSRKNFYFQSFMILL